MGFFNKKGVRCEPMQDGTQKCRIYKSSRNSKEATGTEFNVSLDDNCDFNFTGSMDIASQDDEEMVKHIVSEMQATCRKGIRTR